MHNRACFWKAYCSERVNESQKLVQYAESVLNFQCFEKKAQVFLKLLTPRDVLFQPENLFVILSQIELEKVIFNQIWDFRTAW